MLKWNLKWGKEISTLLEIEKSTGIKPQALQTKPDLDVRCLKYWEGFWVLSRSRGMISTAAAASPAPIPVSEVLAYLNLLYESSVMERIKFLRFMQLMDTEYLTYHAEVSK